jgi:hypothetical protein
MPVKKNTQKNKDLTNVKTKGFTQKVQTFKKSNNTPYTLQEIKELSKQFDKEAQKNNGKYLLRARNEYRDNLTIRSYDGKFYDDEDDYYDERAYDKEKYEKFNVFQIIYIKPN